jgi:hypothetical protein
MSSLIRRRRTPRALSTERCSGERERLVVAAGTGAAS